MSRRSAARLEALRKAAAEHATTAARMDSPRLQTPTRPSLQARSDAPSSAPRRARARVTIGGVTSDERAVGIWFWLDIAEIALLLPIDMILLSMTCRDYRAQFADLHDRALPIWRCWARCMIAQYCREFRSLRSTRPGSGYVRQPVALPRNKVVSKLPPLFFAAIYGHLNVAYLLLHCGARVDAGGLPWICSSLRDTPLIHASENWNSRMMQLLLAFGADPSPLLKPIEPFGRLPHARLEDAEWTPETFASGAAMTSITSTEELEDEESDVDHVDRGSDSDDDLSYAPDSEDDDDDGDDDDDYEQESEGELEAEEDLFRRLFRQAQQHQRERWAALDLRDRVEGQEPAYTRRYRDEWDHLIPWKAADTTPSASVFERYSQQTFRGLLEVYGLELVRPEWGHAPGSIVEARDAAWA